jgi:hypothetical protein
METNMKNKNLSLVSTWLPGLALLAMAGMPMAADLSKAGDGSARALPLDNPQFLDLGKLADLGEAAQKGLAHYRELASPENAAGLGLDAAGDAGKAVLGKPKREFIIRLDALKAHKKGGDVEALLSDTKIVHYPLVVNAKHRGSMSLVQVDGKWEFIGVGDIDRTSLRQSAIAGSVKRFQKNEEDHFIVRVPALNLEFTGFRNRGELQLASVTDNGPAGLTAGEAESAASILERLLPLALAHDGLPR